MKSSQNIVITTLLALSAVGITHSATAQVEYVDPTIGNISILLVPTRPAVYMPNSMVRMYPVRTDATDDQIKSFPLTISSHRIKELFAIMPGNGSPGAYDQEQTTPYYYSTRFDGSLIRTEFTATERCGYFRFTFPTGNTSVVLSNRLAGSFTPISPTTVSGEERFNDMKAYVYGEWSVPVTYALTTDKDKAHLVATAPKAELLEFRYAISFISVDQAKANLQHEIPSWGFDKIKEAGKARWNQTLGEITVEGGTENQRKVFYTSLYRDFERMVNITEDGRYYSNWDHKVHTDPRPFYVDNWLWDTYRALEPLQTLLNPATEADKLQSYVRMYQQSGLMPAFAVLYGNYACMNGNHAAAWFADSYFKGIHNFDIATALEGVRKRSLETTHIPWRLIPNTSLDTFYNTHGYFPALHPGEAETVPEVDKGERRQAVAVTLENSFDDWAISELSRVQSKPADAQLFQQRAAFYKNLYRADKNMFWPKDSDGKWIDPMDPKFDGGKGGRDFYDENNGYTYQWDVAEDFNGLIALMGGPQKTEANLDQLFREPINMRRAEFLNKFDDSTSMIGEFSMGNEPSFAIPFVYDRTGSPWKTQKRVRMILETFFTNTLQGIPGDEDGGGMTAFVVWSMMGLYPVTPGIPTYDIISPVFDKITIHPKDGKPFVITATNNSRDNKYLQSIKLNGQPLNQVWLRHIDILNGGTLELTMGNTPNTSLGANPASFPPASMTVHPEDYAK